MLTKWMAMVGSGLVALAAAGGESLATKHYEQEKNAAQATAQVANAIANHAAVMEIAIERSGPGSEYQAVIKADGTVAYTGGKAAERVGDFNGTVSPAKVQELAGFAVKIGYFNLNSSYRARVADRATVYTSVKLGSTEKIVMNYGDKGPSELKAFEQKIKELLDQVAWMQK